MGKHIGIVVLVLLVIVVLLLSTVAFVADETNDLILITRFGKIDRVVDGRTDPGLHYKIPWPVEKLIRYDARNHVLVSAHRQYNTAEKYNIMATVFCTWRIVDPQQFYRAKETLAQARDAIGALLSSETASVLGQARLEELVNTDPKKMKLLEIQADIRQRVQGRAGQDYGVELTDVGIKSLGLPQSISDAVITAMGEERSKEITKFQAEGQATAEAITGRATAAKQKILEFARRKAADIRTQGEAAAAESYAKFNEDPEFSMFLRSLESLKVSLADRTDFVLDSGVMPILQWLRTEPSLDTFEKKAGKK